MKHFTSQTQKTGELGENITKQYLQSSGFTIKETNYTQKHGEIDIIAEKNRKLHFIEIKSSKVSHETYNPAENLTKKKLQRIHKTVESYIIEHKVSHETPWQIDLYCVFIDPIHGKHKIQIFDNIIL